MKSSGTHIRLGLSRGYYHTWLCIALATRSSSWVAFSQSTSFWLILLDFAVSHLTLHYCTWLCIAHVTCSSSWAAFSLSTSFWPSCTSATPNSKKVSFLALLGRVPTLVAFHIVNPILCMKAIRSGIKVSSSVLLTGCKRMGTCQWNGLKRHSGRHVYKV